MLALAGSGNVHLSHRHDPLSPVKFNHPLGNVKVSRSDGQLRLDWNVSDEVPAEVQFRRRTPTTNWTLVSLFPRSKVTLAPIMLPIWCLHSQSWGFCLPLAPLSSDLMVTSLLEPPPRLVAPLTLPEDAVGINQASLRSSGCLLLRGPCSPASHALVVMVVPLPLGLSSPPTPASQSSMTTSCFLRIIFSFAPSLSPSPAHFSATAAPYLPCFYDPTGASVFPSYKQEMGQESRAAPPFTLALGRRWREDSQAAQ